MKTIILTSQREGDQRFFAELGLKYGMKVVSPRSSNELTHMFTSDAILILDADDPEFLSTKQAFSAPNVFHALKEKTDPQRIFALSDNYVFNNAQLKPPHSQFSNKQIRHNILRKYGQPSTSQAYRVVFDACFKGTPPELSDYFAPGVSIQKFTLKSSVHRKQVVDALQTIMQDARLSERLAARLAQAGDEFLMNAIFDAPRDNLGRAFRREVEREKEFDLIERDAVTFEVALNEDWFGVSVTDLYGSLVYDDVSRSLSLDYQSSKYSVKRDTLGAGLGLYQTTYNGISTVYSVKENAFTRAMIFFPMMKSMKSFRESFEFMSFYLYK